MAKIKFKPWYQIDEVTDQQQTVNAGVVPVCPKTGVSIPYPLKRLIQENQEIVASVEKTDLRKASEGLPAGIAYLIKIKVPKPGEYDDIWWISQEWVESLEQISEDPRPLAPENYFKQMQRKLQGETQQEE